MPSARLWLPYYATALLLMTTVVHAQEPVPPLVEAERFEVPSTDEPAIVPPTTPPGIEKIQGDIADIKLDIQLLQETLNLIVNRMMADLEQENAQLRAEVQRLQEGGASNANDVGSAFVPRPGASLIEDAAAEEPAALPMPEVMEPEAFRWDVISEWGRDPDTAASLGADVSSLKGMVLVVPPNSLREDVEKLARELRSQHAAYDNINIEIYDSQEAGRSYAERQVANPDHRVASISKHKASGRDTILYLHGDKAEPVPIAP